MKAKPGALRAEETPAGSRRAALVAVPVNQVIEAGTVQEDTDIVLVKTNPVFATRSKLGVTSRAYPKQPT